MARKDSGKGFQRVFFFKELYKRGVILGTSAKKLIRIKHSLCIGARRKPWTTVRVGLDLSLHQSGPVRSLAPSIIWFGPSTGPVHPSGLVHASGPVRCLVWCIHLVRFMVWSGQLSDPVHRLVRSIAWSRSSAWSIPSSGRVHHLVRSIVWSCALSDSVDGLDRSIV